MTKKALRIEPIPQSAMVRIVWEGGGEVPASLSGSYTSPLVAKQAIATWEAVHRDEPVVVVVKREEDEKKQQQKEKPTAKEISPL